MKGTCRKCKGVESLIAAPGVVRKTRRLTVGRFRRAHEIPSAQCDKKTNFRWNQT